MSAVLRILSSTSGKSSKFDVSSIDFTSTGIAAGLSLRIQTNKGQIKYFDFFRAFSPNMFPIYASKERVLLDLFKSTVRANASVGLATESHYEISRFIRDGHLWWKNEGLTPSHHLTVSVLRCVRAEGRISNKHLVHYHTQWPPIGTASIAKTY